MIVLLHNKINGDLNEIEYPNVDINEPICNLTNSLELFYIKDSVIPDYDARLQYLKISYQLTDVTSKYVHLKIANKNYEVLKKPNDEIINELNIVVGNLIEQNLPIWKQIKYSELLGFGNITDDTRQYYRNIIEWKNECRIERDKKELDLINNNFLPDLNNWPLIPIKK